MKIFQLLTQWLRQRQPVWQLEKPRLEIDGNLHRVILNAPQGPVWFESTDVPLAASVEASASFFLLPALLHCVSIRADFRLDPLWLANARKLVAIFAQWWNYSSKFPFQRRMRSGSARQSPASGTGLCFTGGLDSFHSLLTNQDTVTHLIFVHGFDVPLTDTVRFAACRDMVKRVATATGAKAVIVSTNLRMHPLFRLVPWTRSHGAALAGTGHLLAEVIGRLLIASSFSKRRNRPFGSHWLTDPLWGSSVLELVNDAADLDRYEKAVLIAAEPLVWENLRVCWENRAPTGNCSRCEKCLRTMMLLSAEGQLHNYARVFDVTTPLAALIDELPFLPKQRLMFRWEENMQRHPHADVRAAAERLLQRCQTKYSSKATSTRPASLC